MRNDSDAAQKPPKEAIDDLLQKALREPGVKEAVELYERAESAYEGLATSVEPAEYTRSSTNP